MGGGGGWAGDGWAIEGMRSSAHTVAPLACAEEREVRGVGTPRRGCSPHAHDSSDRLARGQIPSRCHRSVVVALGARRAAACRLVVQGRLLLRSDPGTQRMIQGPQFIVPTVYRLQSCALHSRISTIARCVPVTRAALSPRLCHTAVQHSHIHVPRTNSLAERACKVTRDGFFRWPRVSGAVSR